MALHHLIKTEGTPVYMDERCVKNDAWERNFVSLLIEVGKYSKTFVWCDSKVKETISIHAQAQADGFLVALFAVYRCQDLTGEGEDTMSIHTLSGKQLRPHTRRLLSGRMLRPLRRQQVWDDQTVDDLAVKRRRQA